MGSDLTAILDKAEPSSFKFSFSFLPKNQKEAINTVYAFCRTTDNIVDSDNEINKKAVYLRHWQIELGKAIRSESKYQLLNKLISIAKIFHIPYQHFYELIQGMEMDLIKNRYENFEELKEYCYLVASSVGMMIIKIFGPVNERIINYAHNLGIALQLTNILRDLKYDAKLNRIYIPKEDLKRFNYSEAELLNFVYNDNFIKLMEFETNRAEEFYENAQSYLTPEDRKYLFAPKIMERIYFHTLKRIKAKKYNVFENTVKLPGILQLLIAIKYFIKIRLFKFV